MTALSKMTLEELYARPKITTATEIAIRAKSDFSTMNPTWCEKICRLKCKAPSGVSLISAEVDILIIQDHQAPEGKFDRRPGQQESIQQEVLAFVAEKAGFKGLTYRFISLLKCPASSKDFPLGKPPTQTTLQKCFPYLEGEILRAKPKVIVSLGTATTKALGLKSHSNTGNRGQITICKYGMPVIMTLHPKIMTMIRQNARGAAGMWGPDYLPIITRDFQKAAQLVRGELVYTADTLKNAVAKLLAENIRIAKTIEDVAQFMAEIDALPSDKIVSFDTETTSLDPLDPDLKILSIQFGWRDATGKIVAVVIPLWHRKNTFYDPEAAWQFVVPFLEGPRFKVGHNSKYDILVIYWAKKVRVQGVKFDTLLLLHSICSGAQGTYGLKSAVWDRLTEMGIGGYEDELGDLKLLKKQLEKAQGEVDVDTLEISDDVFEMMMGEEE